MLLKKFHLKKLDTDKKKEILKKVVVPGDCIAENKCTSYGLQQPLHIPVNYSLSKKNVRPIFVRSAHSFKSKVSNYSSKTGSKSIDNVQTPLTPLIFSNTGALVQTTNISQNSTSSVKKQDCQQCTIYTPPRAAIDFCIAFTEEKEKQAAIQLNKSKGSPQCFLYVYYNIIIFCI